MKYLVAFFIFLMTLLPTTVLAMGNANSDGYHCKVAVEKVIEMPKGKNLQIKVGCDSPNGYRLFVSSPFSNLPVRDVLNSDTGGVKSFKIHVTGYEFKHNYLRVEPTR